MASVQVTICEATIFSELDVCHVLDEAFIRNFTRRYAFPCFLRPMFRRNLD